MEFWVYIFHDPYVSFYQGTVNVRLLLIVFREEAQDLFLFKLKQGQIQVNGFFQDNKIGIRQVYVRTVDKYSKGAILKSKNFILYEELFKS